VRRQIRQHALRDDLRQRHHDRYRYDRRDECERHVAAPVDRLARRYRHDIFHGELSLDQLFVTRPLLGWARYKAKAILGSMKRRRP
jgi:phytoene dehydrogenase-like protein